MKKNYFLGFLLLGTSMGFAQKTIIVNGGLFGNQSENVNLMVYDPAVANTRVIDTIHSQSVQEILFDGNIAYVAAQDSLVAYNIDTELRVAATRFPGLSTKSLAMGLNEILVGNFYGQGANNLYLFDKANLAIVDTIPWASKAVKSILVHNGFAYFPQNDQTSNYQDTSGYILRMNLATRSIADTIRVSAYSGDFGELVPLTNGTGFLAVNSASNTITKVLYANVNNAQNTAIGMDLRVGGRSHYTLQRDTLFLRMGNGIGSLSTQNLSLLDSNIVDTVVTAFSYDTLSHLFYITQTDFFSFTKGAIYNRQGNKLSALTVGHSPEVVRVYYSNTLGLSQREAKVEWFSVFPNPSEGRVQLDLSEVDAAQLNAELYNQNGQLIQRYQLNAASNRLDLSSLPAGLYFMRIQDNEKQYRAKIMLN